MNLLVVRTPAEHAALPSVDARTQHVRSVLRLRVGDTFYVGQPNGPRGLATLTADDAEGIRYVVDWEPEPLKPQALELLLGLPRPQTARKVLHDAASMGLRAVHVFSAEKGEPSYAESKLWRSDEWARRLEEGAAQAFSTTIPAVTHAKSLAACIENLDTGSIPRYALDIYESPHALAEVLREDPQPEAAMLAVGSERGWSAAEREVLRANGFALVHLGERVLRTESAVVAGASLLLAHLGGLDQPYVPGR